MSDFVWVWMAVIDSGYVGRFHLVVPIDCRVRNCVISNLPWGFWRSCIAHLTWDMSVFVWVRSWVVVIDSGLGSPYRSDVFTSQLTPRAAVFMVIEHHRYARPAKDFRVPIVV